MIVDPKKYMNIEHFILQIEIKFMSFRMNVLHISQTQRLAPFMSNQDLEWNKTNKWISAEFEMTCKQMVNHCDHVLGIKKKILK